MKQGSIMSFMTNKGKDNKESKDSLKQLESPKVNKTQIQSTSQAKSMSKAINSKKRKLIDDEESEPQNEQAEDLLISSNIDEASNIKNLDINNSENSIPFMTLVTALSHIEQCKGQNSKAAIKETFANLFKDIILNTPNDLSRAYYFLLSKVGPEYKSPEFGMGTGTLEKCVGKSIGKSDKHIKDQMVELGDLALVAMEGKKTLGTMDKFSGFVKTVKKDLTLKQVMDSFRELANIKGKSSFAEKEKLLVKLMFNANRDEVKYLVRSLQKGLKIGANFKTFIAAMAKSIAKIYIDYKINLEEKEAERALLLSINQLSDEDIVFKNMIDVVKKRENFNNLIELCEITPGIPVKPQLAKPTTGINIVFQRFEGVPFTCEYKYDGFRGQVHHYPVYKDKKLEFNKTEIFSRNLENMTESYPDLVAHIEKLHSENASSFILDCEIVAFDKKTKKILPFHQLTTRGRKNVNIDEISIHVCMFLFDIIYLNGKNICSLNLDERRKLLLENFKEDEFIQHAKVSNSDKFEEIETFMQESIVGGIYKIFN